MRKGDVKPLRERLERYSIPEPNSGCTLWFGAITARGYGRLLYQGKARTTHRLAWECAHGAIPDRLHVLHKCDVPACINPDHLFLGTNADNMADKMAKGRIPRMESKGGFRGVVPHRLRFMAKISNRPHGGTKYLGMFLTAEEAARAFDRAARERWGLIAQFNFPEDQK